MKHSAISVLALAVCLTLSTGALAERMTKQKFNAQLKILDAEYKQNQEKCEILNWNANEVCEVEAKSKLNIDRAELMANYKPSAKSRQQAGMTKADANFLVAIVRCNDATPEQKEACMNDAVLEKATALEEAQAQFNVSKPDGTPKEKSRESNSTVMDKEISKNIEKTKRI